MLKKAEERKLAQAKRLGHRACSQGTSFSGFWMAADWKHIVRVLFLWYLIDY
ncbi:hypothetical protein HM1_1452 [Heliomicrobium modesticaldum Ice1]|uniref:Uncharacterized protein n=1 Tax=Heliobacterium modesticaldum (strain ATCC 51547 / Ice1) TaxID=498761 RepID=B0TCJ9_HELMI|nr:hypothetical protein HM1_1452 [Heliomicrobium modesticaldum Ice1]